MVKRRNHQKKKKSYFEKNDNERTINQNFDKIGYLGSHLRKQEENDQINPK